MYLLTTPRLLIFFVLSTSWCALGTSDNTDSSKKSQTKSKKKKSSKKGKKGNTSKDAGSDSEKPQGARLELCRPSLKFAIDPPKKLPSMSFCGQHAGHTCCDAPHVNRIFSKHQGSGVEAMQSKKCAAFTRKALCASCDGDVGTSTRSTRIAMCPSFCGSWYSACKDELWLVKGSSNDVELVPCNGEMGCQTLTELMGGEEDEDQVNPVEFCEAAFSTFQPFEVANPADEPDLCFDGVPSARYKTGISPEEIAQRAARKSNQGYHADMKLWDKFRYHFLLPLMNDMRNNPQAASVMISLTLFWMSIVAYKIYSYGTTYNRYQNRMKHVKSTAKAESKPAESSSEAEAESEKDEGEQLEAPEDRDAGQLEDQEQQQVEAEILRMRAVASAAVEVQRAPVGPMKKIIPEPPSPDAADAGGGGGGA